MKEKYALLYWSAARGFGNVGDELSKVIVQKLNPSIKSVYECEYEHQFIAVGSFASRAVRGDVIWGSGLHDGTETTDFSGVNITLVRGPLTAEILRRTSDDVPTVYGDPALLMPKFYSPPTTKRHKYGIVAQVHHVYQLQQFVDDLDSDDYLFLSPHLHYEEFIEKLVSCERVISTSLHGLILADAYQVPNSYFFFRPIPEGEFKFRDYFASQDREFRHITVLKEAIEECHVGRKINPDTILHTFPVLS